MMLRILAVCLLECAASGALGEQVTGAPTAPREADVQVFRTYCASCHGVAGRGDGPVAGELKNVPPDLTKYTERNGGVFPSERLLQLIDGRGLAVHGTREMPVWGDAFKSAKDGLTPEAAKGRIEAVVRYLRAIQQRAAD
jgi:mono/diheme cytochrome c family protein